MDNDEWFFNSFKRYNELQMFDFPNAVQEMDLTSTNNLCVALNEDGKNRNEILIFFLPSSLHTNKLIEGVKLDRHLSFDHGYFTNSRLSQIQCIPNEEKLIVSEKDGVALYDISCTDSDIIKKLTNVPCDIPDVRLAVSGPNHLLAYSSATSTLKRVVDFVSTKVVFDIDGGENPTSPFFVSPELISFGDTLSGQITSYDVKSGKHAMTIASPGARAHWRFDTMFNIKRQTVADAGNVFSFSTNGEFLVHDVRKPSQPAVRAKHNLSFPINNAAANVQMNVCPANTSFFSVCGFDENVYVCELRDDTANVIFAHDGHSYSSEEFEPNVSTVCSLWLPFISANTLVSCASNCSVQCWQYKIS